MCDEDTVNDVEASKLSRRQFNTLTAGAALSVMLPAVANAKSVSEREVVIQTPDGEADCYFVHPSSGKSPAVLIWPDILGLRPAFRQMGKRLAESGYAVLVINPYYRNALSPVVKEGDTFQDPNVRKLVMPFYRALSAETTTSDAKAFVQFIDAQSAVDTNKKIGTTGYCMGGPMTLQAAATIPNRIGAVGSFHGGGLVTDDKTSPHLLIPKMKASFLIAIADNDDAKYPEVKGVLRSAYDAAELNAEIEVYKGALHGWCPPDSPAYHEVQAERAWTRMLAVFGDALV
ncbi:MAG: carboxymethylenebutenolidase [Candidatus Azotimanducaceae bacterium]|jgi:carboxymethylenebutenolidase